MKCMAGVIALVAVGVSPAVAQTSGSAPAFALLDSLAPPAALAVPISVRLNKVALRDAINDVAQRANVGIVFDPALAGLGRMVSIDAQRVPAARVLLRLLDGSNLQAMVSPSGSIVLTARALRDEVKQLVGGTIRQPAGPLGGVNVSLVGTRFETVTDALGRFTFGAVSPGRYVLRALRMGYAPVNQQILIEPSVASLALDMVPVAVPIDAVIVTPGYFGVMQPGMATAQALTRQQIETVPQLGEDVYRAVARLPGVAMDDFSAKFSVRGEPGDGLAVTFDGLPLIEPFHLKDLGNALSIVDLWSLGGAELITGGPSAEYGDQIGGVFRMHSMEPRGDRTRGSAGLSLTNLRGGAQGGFANGQGGWLVAGRRGYLDLAFKLAGIDDSIKPKYNDIYAKVSYTLPGGGRIGAHALHSGDEMTYRDVNSPSIESGYTSDYGWLTSASRIGTRLRQEGALWIGRLDWSRLGFQSSSQGTTIRIDDARSLNTMGVREDWSLDVGKRMLFKAGATLRHERATYDYSSYFRRNVVANHQLTVRTDSSAIDLDPTSDRVEAYLSQRVRPIDALTIEAGVRYDRASHSGDQLLTPRVNASWQPSSSTTVRGSWGIHVQSESVFGLQVEDGVHEFMRAERANQAVVGVEQALPGGLAARVEAYDRRLSDLRPRYVNASSRVVTFPEMEDDRMLLAPTAGRSRGVEMSIERDGGQRMDWAASYVVSSSTQRVGDAWIPRVSDQPRAFRLDWSLHPVSNAWRLSMSQMWHTGWPYTPDLARVDTVPRSPRDTSLYTIHFRGPLYSERVPAYQRVDARWTRFIDTRSGRLSLFLEVYNLLNTRNLRERYTNLRYNFSQGKYSYTPIQESRDQLPRIPSFGVNWEF